jgi:hypothetical protein
VDMGMPKKWKERIFFFCGKTSIRLAACQRIKVF